MPQPVADGSHLTNWWQHILSQLQTWQPDFELDELGGAQAMRILMNDLHSRFDFSGHKALAEFEVEDCLRRLSVPTLALTATTDPLRDQHDKVLSLVARVQGHEFQGGHPIHDPTRADEYVDVVVDFIESGGSWRHPQAR